MREELEALEKLQELDTQVYDIQQQRDAIPRKIQELKGHLDALRGILDRERLELEQAERERREHEAELEASLNMIDASNNKLKGVKNTKEYHAISKELESQKRINGDKEEEILRLMEVVQQGNESMHAHEQEFNDLLGVVKREEAEGAEKIKELDGGLGALDGQREQYLGLVRRNVLRRYDMIRKKKQGLAVVRVIAGGCQGCNMQLPPQLFNNLMRQSSIEICPTCHRILLYKAPVEDAAAEAT